MEIMGTILILLSATLGAMAQTVLTPAPAPEPQGQTPTFRTGVAQVRLDVQVVEGKEIVRGLDKSDFVVYDNGVEQPLTYFGREPAHVRLLLLLDVSGSMKKHLQLMATTARQAMHYMRFGDRVGIMLFSRDTKVREEFTTDLGEVTREIQDSVWDENMGAGTAINASLLSAAGYMRSYSEQEDGAEQAHEHRAVLIVTDNLSLNYKTPDEEVLRALYENDTVLNAIVMGKGERPGAAPPGRVRNPDFSPSDVFYLSEQSGGEAVKAERADAAFPEMIERIRTRYTLLYSPPPARPAEFRRVRVELTPATRKLYPKAIVRCRAGYYASR